MRTLILVDIQNDFLPGGALAVPAGDQVIAVANRLLPQFPLAVATQDWHPPNHLSFAANHEGKRPGDVVQLAGLEQTLWPVHCVQQTAGAALAARLDQRRIDKVFQKGTDPQIDSYSGFFDNGHRRGTGLGDFLKQRGVTDVYILGLATDYCVKHTALDARQLGFRTFLIEDGCRAVNAQPGDACAALEQMRAAGVTILSSRDLAGW